MSINSVFIALGSVNPGLAPLAFMGRDHGSGGMDASGSDAVTLGDIALASPKGAVAVLLIVALFVTAITALGVGAAYLSMLAPTHLHGWTMVFAIGAVWTAWGALTVVGLWRLLTR